MYCNYGSYGSSLRLIKGCRISVRAFVAYVVEGFVVYVVLNFVELFVVYLVSVLVNILCNMCCSNTL